jgi:hypothetical protein
MTTIDPYCRTHADPQPGHRARSHIRPIAAAAAIAMPALLGGCAVVSIAGTAASVAATAASTAIDVGVGAVKVTGKVIGKGVDLVTGPGASPTPSRQ